MKPASKKSVKRKRNTKIVVKRAIIQANPKRRVASAKRKGKRNPGKTIYERGDLAEYTGNSQVLHGGLFYEIRWLEGTKKGQLGVTGRPPEGEDPFVAKQRREWEEQQAGFRRLAAAQKRISAEKKKKKNPQYKVSAKVPSHIRPITHEVKVPTRTLAVLATRGYVQEMGGGNPNAYTYKTTRLGLGTWRIEAIPKVKSSSGTVKALTAGSAVRKFKKTLAGRGRFKTPRGAYEISVERNPKRKAASRKRRNPKAAGFEAAGKIYRKLEELKKQPITMRRTAAIAKLEKALEKAYASAYAAERAKDSQIYEAPRSFSTAKRKGGGVRKKKANPSRKPASKVRRKNSISSTVKKVVKSVKKAFRNDGHSNRKKFAGKLSGDKDLFFPPGTPPADELSTLGPLESFTTTGRGKITFQKGQAVLCQDADDNLYVGMTKPSAAFFSNGGPLRNADLGKIKQVEYECAKPHLGEKYKKNTPWFHGFKSPLPHLKTDEEGRPIIKGGGYRIEPEGITG